MSNPGFRLAEARPVVAPGRRLPLGRLLVDAGLLGTEDLLRALDLQRKYNALLGDILVAEGLVHEADVLDALARQHQVARVRMDVDPPEDGLAKAIPVGVCQTHMVLPWRKIGRTLFVAMAHPEQLDDLRTSLGDGHDTIIPVIASRADIQTHIGKLHGAELARQIVERVPEHLSARTWGKKTGLRSAVAAGTLLLLGTTLALVPAWSFGAMLAFAVMLLAITLMLKVSAFVAQLLHNAAEGTQAPRLSSPPTRWPCVSVMVPLYKEREIASVLIKRLERLRYPKCLLDVVLVLEAKDTITIETIARTPMPSWITVVEVPDDGTITTKPRALNYALDFCRGQIVGVWDAEDAPEPDQIEKIVMRFHEAPANVACLQGMLDFYNARTNWIARCFTIEYATWWRVVLPGLARLGFVIPLGGTTLFFRRDILETLGAWDAHNVTEDADLGIRLARAGYVTELVPTVTMEEANCRALPWVRQRSRWLKGFLITYLVHMRAPRALLRDLGPQRFFGIQVLFFATFMLFAAMPLFWLFWLPWIGLPAAFTAEFGGEITVFLGIFFLTAELLNIIIGMVAVSGPRHRHLLAWVITMPIYFVMGAFAAYKALFEMVVTPFYWDKTSHGVTEEEGAAE